MTRAYLSTQHFIIPSPSNGIFVIFSSLTLCSVWNSSSTWTIILANLLLVPVGYAAAHQSTIRIGDALRTHPACITEPQFNHFRISKTWKTHPKGCWYTWKPPMNTDHDNSFAAAQDILVEGCASLGCIQRVPSLR